MSSSAAVTALVGRAEDLYFDAKTCSVPFSAHDQQHLAEALSGFANADGGVLVYGLVARGGDRSKPDVVTAVRRKIRARKQIFKLRPIPCSGTLAVVEDVADEISNELDHSTARACSRASSSKKSLRKILLEWHTCVPRKTSPQDENCFKSRPFRSGRELASPLK